MAIRRYVLGAVATSLVLGEAVAFPHFVQTGSHSFKMEKPDGGIEHFVRAVDEPRIILGENGWIGETEGARAMVVRREEDGTYSLGFLFNFGTLIACMENGRERNVVPTSPQESAEAFGNLWTLDEKTRNLRIPPRRLGDERKIETLV